MKFLNRRSIFVASGTAASILSSRAGCVSSFASSTARSSPVSFLLGARITNHSGRSTICREMSASSLEYCKSEIASNDVSIRIDFIRNKKKYMITLGRLIFM